MFLLLYLVLFISSLKACPLKTVNIRSGCYCGIEIDGTNYIHCHPYSINNIPKFTRSYIHNKLNLSNNFIENLTNLSFNQLKVQRIYLERNPIQYIDKRTFHKNLRHYLEELYIDTINNNTLEFLCYGTWKKLRILKLSGFNLNQYQYCFNKLYYLEKLFIQHSEINIISYHIYKLPFLFELSLTNNQIEYFNFDDQYLFYSSSIHILNLTSNQLRIIPNNLHIRMPNLITLDLSDNLIENFLMIDQMSTLNINLSFNLINYIQINNDTNDQYLINLSNNPICTIETTINSSNILMNNLKNLHCDCRLAYVIEKNLTNLSKRIGNHLLFGEQTVCATPLTFQGLYLKDLTFEQLISTCSLDLPNHCKEVTNFKRIQKYVDNLIHTTESISIEMDQRSENSTTYIIETREKINIDQDVISSFHLTLFNTHYENDNLLIVWDFDANFSSNHIMNTNFQIIIEEQFSSKIEIIRQSGFISPYLKQYIVSHLPSNRIYHACLLITRSSGDNDKYCREIRTSINHILTVNHSVIFGFLIGTILTTCFLVILAFVYHLRYRQKYFYHSYHHYQRQHEKNYMCVGRNDVNGTYSYSIMTSPLSKYTHYRKNRHRTHLKSTSLWCHPKSAQLPPISHSPCCFLRYHDRILSGSRTTNRMTSISSDYSNEVDKEQTTSTSMMSNTSSDEQQNNIIQSSAKHRYEELGENNLFL